jgi:hypothetical protein
VSLAAAVELSREIADAGRSLARFDPLWHEGLDISWSGFRRSFFAPLFGLPFHLVFAAFILSKGGAEPIGTAEILVLVLAYLINAFGMPALVAAVSRPFGFQAGYPPFVILLNWSGLFFNMGLCLIAPLSLLGARGVDGLGFLWMVILALRIFITWRSARSTLSNDFAPALLMVVLLVAVDWGADQIAALVIRGGN